ILFEFQNGYSPGRLPDELEQLQAWLQGRIYPRFPSFSDMKNPIYVLEYRRALHPLQVAKLWAHSEAVAYAEPEYIPKPLLELRSCEPAEKEISSPEQINYTPNDLHAQNYCLTHLHVLPAWDITTGDPSVWIGIVDTDVRFDHPDLEGNIAYNTNDPINGVDDDGDGYVDNYHGWDIVGNYSGAGPFQPDNDPRTANPGHGTWVAGYAGATTDNGIGIAAPAFQCRILPIKAASDDGILYGAYDGVLYAAQRGAKVINCSWGSPYRSQAAQNFIKNLVDTYDPVIVGGAGNVPPDTPAAFYPALYEGVIGVTAVNTSDVWGGHVQIDYGIDLCTTGEGITTTGLNSYFSFGTATSFASPQAAGCAAILRAQRPTLNAYQIAELLRITADSVEPANSPHLRYRLGRRINLYRAVTTQDTPACRVVSWQAYDNNDEAFFANEIFYLTATYRNFLSPVNNLTVRVEPLSPHLQVVPGQGSYTIGTLGTLQSHTQAAGSPFALQVMPTCPPNARIPILFRFEGDDGYEDYQVIELRWVNPAFAHLDSARLRTTICGNGRVGYYDTPANTQGRGARWQGFASSWLFEGGLAIADNTNAHLCTRAPGGRMYSHFQPTQAATKTVQGLYEIGEVAFADTGGIQGAKGLSILGRAYAPRRAPLNTFVAFVYEISNPSSSDYLDLSVGWWLDFDVGSNPATDQVNIHSTLPLVYARNSAGNRYIGAVLLSGQPSISRIGVVDTFSAIPAVYIHLLRQTGGVTTATGDIFAVISAQDVDLLAGGKDTVAFALVGGTSLTQLLNNAQAAIDWYLCFIQGAGPVVDLGPDRDICLGDTLFAQSPSGSHYEWSTGLSGPRDYILPSLSGLYWVMVQDAQGCWGYDEVILLNVNSLTPAQVQFLPGLTVSVGTPLEGFEQSGAGYQCTWFVETSSGWEIYSGCSFSHTYTTTGVYQVRLKRTDPNTGCSDSLSWQITVSQQSELSKIGEGMVLLSPNPTQGTFSIIYHREMAGLLTLRDMTGRVVWQTPLSPSGSSYSLPSSLAGGIYRWEIGGTHGYLIYAP
ncbi:MAG: S8 family serine peptidase, partial [Bacteroidia bacterium]|nr:S8 family serine peptidase [Bacteroidia bacterium]